MKEELCELYEIKKKDIYVLKQSDRLWNDTLNDKLIEIGFKRLKSELCVYIKNS